VSAEVLTEKMHGFGHRSANYAGTVENAVEAVLSVAREGDAVLTLGAGNVWQAGDRILARLRGDS
jgi:UDP-N-acetylmuramate--alanine ligase